MIHDRIDPSTRRAAGLASLTGALTMLAGAACWGASGTDLWAALANDTMAQHLADAAQARTLLLANMLLWIIGVLLMAIGGTLMACLCIHRQSLAQAGAVGMRIAAAIAMVSFVLMQAITMYPSAEAGPAIIALYSAIGWAGANLDDIATVLIVGIGPLTLGIAGHGAWAPGWLRAWGILAGVIGTFGLATTFVRLDHPMSMVIIPLGIGWMIAAGVVLLRRTDPQGST